MEVACCDPYHEGAWHGAWDECNVLAERVASFDVRIVSDGQCYKHVPRRFVRKLGERSPQAAQPMPAQHGKLASPSAALPAAGGAVGQGAAASLHSVAQDCRDPDRNKLKVIVGPGPAAVLPEPAASEAQPPQPERTPHVPAAPPCRVVLRRPTGGGRVHAQEGGEEVEVDEVAFMGRFMALRQFLELARKHA